MPVVNAWGESIKNGPPAPFTIAPDQVIGMLIQADHIKLEGFGGVAQKLPFWVPVATGFELPKVEVDIQRNRRRVEVIQWGVLLVVVVLFIALVLVLSVGGPSGSSITWRVKSVQARGIAVMLGEGEQKVQSFIPVGSMLPSGELLRSVDTGLQSYTTDTQIIVVKK